MDRVNGADWFDIGDGKRGFRSQNAGAGIPGTEVTAAWLNGVQEELTKVIEAAGIELNAADNTQLYQALLRVSLIRMALSNPWIPVISMDLTAPPAAPVEGDAYLIAAAATGLWAGKSGWLAERAGAAWFYTSPKDGHGISLPDGRIFLRRAGTYVELVASYTERGLIQLATVDEIKAGAAADRAVSPATLTAKPASSFNYYCQQPLPNGVSTILTTLTATRHEEFVDATRVNVTITLGEKDAGVWQINASGQIVSGSSFSVAILKNGATLAENNVSSGVAVAVSVLSRFAVGDVLTFQYRQIAGASQQVTAFLSGSRFGA